ncbi:hypothetical protein ACQ4LE_003855 [Meloidogyne hapla]
MPSTFKTTYNFGKLVAFKRGDEYINWTFYATNFWCFKLAKIYRLVDLFQWSQGIYNHITLHLPGTDPAKVLINPFGLLYNEVTASSLIKLSLSGDVMDQGSTNLGVNQAAYVLHSAIHEARQG